MIKTALRRHICGPFTAHDQRRKRHRVASVSLDQVPDAIGQACRPPVLQDRHDHFGRRHHLIAAQDALAKHHGSAADFAMRRFDDELIIHQGGLEPIDLHPADHEKDPALPMELLLVDATGPDEFRPPTLEKAQIRRMIDDAGKLWLANIATQRLDSIGALEGYSVNKRRFSTLLP